MSEEFLGLLDGEEEVVMSDSANIFESGGGKLVLTSKRLFFCVAKGLFNRELVVKKEVALNDIANVRGDIGKTSVITGVTGNSWLIVETRNGEEWRCGFFSAGMDIWAGHNVAQTQSMTKVMNWVSSIKLELLRIAQSRDVELTTTTLRQTKQTEGICGNCIRFGTKDCVLNAVATDAPACPDFQRKCGGKQQNQRS